MDKAAVGRLRRTLATLVVIAANVALWLRMHDVAYQVAMNRDVLLGRYTVGQFSALTVFLIISVLALVLLWTKPGGRRRRAVQLVVMSVVVLITCVLFDAVLRRMQPGHYVTEGAFERRQPNQALTGVTRDVPTTAFSYPTLRGGYADVPYTLTTDARGFRNPSALDACDVLVLGDSFAEGTEVSDNQTWVSLVAGHTGKRVYNLGLAGSGLDDYLARLEAIGLALQPKTVLMMFYEGNDFRGGGEPTRRTDFGYRLRVYRKRSPVLLMLRRAMIGAFGPVGAVRTDDVPKDHPLWPVAWLPLAAPAGADAKYYALEHKRLRAHYISSENFRASEGFRAATDILTRMADLCKARHIRFIVVYVPDKPHVVLPIVRDCLDAEQVRAFLALNVDGLPPADELLDTLISRLDVRENALADFCRGRSIAFVSLTHALREHTAAAEQTYFTYDQHWTPVGNRVVANVINLALMNRIVY